MARAPQVVSVIEVSLAGLPDVLWALRREMAQVLREQAEDEVSGYVKGRLQEIAAAFEVGGRGEDGLGGKHPL